MSVKSYDDFVKGFSPQVVAENRATVDQLYHFEHMSHHLNKGTKIDVDKNNKLYVVSCGKRIINGIFGLNAARLRRIIVLYNNALDQLELQPVKLKPENAELYKGYLKVGEVLKKATKSYRGTAKERNALYHRLIALGYRAGIVPTVESSADDAMRQSLHKAAAVWKKSILRSDKEHALSELDNKRLEKLLRHKKFVVHLNKDHALREVCFKAILQTHIQPDALIQYPHLFNKLSEAQMIEPLGYFYGTSLRVHANEAGEKHLELRVIGETDEADAKLRTQRPHWVPLEDPNREVRLEKGVTKTVKDIFEEFRQRDARWINYGVFAKGVRNYNALHMGPFNAETGLYEHSFHLNSPDWYKELPRKWMSADEARERYGAEVANGRDWVYRVVATRGAKLRTPNARHAYREMCYPNPDTKKGGYYLITFGKFPTTLPANWLEEPFYAAQIFPGAIVSPDPTIVDSKRQHGGVPERYTPSQAMVKLAEIKRDIFKGFQGTMNYQYFIDNCAIWADSEKKYFLTQINMADAGSPFMRFLLKLVLCLPYKIQHCVFTILFCLFGGCKKREIHTPAGRVSAGLLNKQTAPWMPAVNPNNANPRDDQKRNMFMIPDHTDAVWRASAGG